MSDKKHIDRLYQEKFKDFEVKPSANVWTGIQNKIEQPKEETKVGFPIWLRIASVAAVLVLLLTVGKFTFSDNMLEESNTTTVDSKTTKSKNSDTSSNVEDINAVSIESTNTLKENNTITENKLLNNVTVVANENDSKSNSPSKTNKNKVSNLSSQFSNTKGVSKENSLNTNGIIVNKKDNSNINRVAKNLKNRDNLNAPNNSQRIAQNASAKNINTTILNSNNPENTITNNNTNSITNSKNLSNISANNATSTANKPNTKTTTVLDNNSTTATTAVATANSEKEKEEKKMMEPDSANSSNTIEEALAKIENLDEEEKINRWSVSANAAPVYYNTLGKGSHIDDQFIDNPKNGEINTSYGIKVGYNVGNRLKVRSGINKLNLSYDTANVIVFNSVSNTPNISSFRTIDFIPDNQGQTFSVLSSSNLVVQQVDDLINNNLNAALSQRISYFEVPLELEYALVNKKFGLNIIGGASAFFLNDNEVVSEIINQKRKIGEANNINNISYSANIGLGIDYKFSDKLKFNFEPTFKYQMDAYSETSGNFNPYIIGVYTGFSYKF
ncbi:hypothetical protein [Lacinutrix sp.]|uniref:hypothetical protein n=1 Tax=Lacinutrix sp. TaxID=1937692 RepID=UPI0025BA3A84|nr:hypothetical protein [Lacinutrix sp.]